MGLVGISRNPVPSGAVEGELKTPDGARIRFARWAPVKSPNRGTVCVLGGRTEPIEKYFETIAELRRRGFGVAAMDWRGQGGSSRPLANPRKGHIDDFATYEADLARFMSDIVLPDCPAPYFALAHSMGANILLRTATARSCRFDRVVLVAPMLRLEPPSLMSRWVSGGAELALFLGLGDMYVPGGKDHVQEVKPFEDNVLTSDPERYARNQALLTQAPQLGLGSPTMGWLNAALDSMALVGDFEFPPQVRVPLLMFAAGRDAVVSTPAIEELSVRLKAGDHVLVPGARHELLQERDRFRFQFWAAFDAFIPGAARASDSARLTPIGL